MLAAESL